ncbi:MAG: SCO family protein [Chloroflexi bacterium]|nr:SCO family protein [Chloroflexota bacterium]
MVGEVRDTMSPKLARRIFVRVLVLAGLFALGVATAIGATRRLTSPYTFNGMPFEPPPPAPQFALMNQDRQLVRSSDLIGKPTLVYFGWTHCKDACPLTFAKWQRVVNLLGADAEQVHFVFISVDPKRDTPERIKEYLANSSPKFVGLVGSLEELDDVLQNYLAYYKEEIAHDHEIDILHTTLTYLIDSRGRLTLAFRLDASAEEIASDVRYLIKQ